MSGGGLARSYISGRGPGLGPEARGQPPSPSHQPVGVSTFCKLGVCGQSGFGNSDFK